MIDKILEFRKELHQHPELSGQEKGTAKRVRDFIGEDANTKVISGLGGNGVAVLYEYSEKGPVIMLRCELDALPIEEVNSFAHRSLNQGVSHKCGHDGHMAIVAGMIFWLKSQSFENGKVILLFQPAEETGKGAYNVLYDPKFQGLQPDYVFAFHNIPGEPLHSIIKAEKFFSTTVISLAVKLTGQQSHSSEPEKGINPAPAMAEIIQQFDLLNKPDIQNPDFTLLTPVYSRMGSINYGISAGFGELHYTLRTVSENTMDALKAKLMETVGQVAAKYSLEYTSEWFDYFPATENDQECNRIIKTAAKSNDFTLLERPYSFKFGEDFGWFSQRYKAAMFGIGAGESCPALHKEEYDFPEELLTTGITMFSEIITGILTPPSRK